AANQPVLAAERPADFKFSAGDATGHGTGDTIRADHQGNRTTAACVSAAQHGSTDIHAAAANSVLSREQLQRAAEIKRVASQPEALARRLARVVLAHASGYEGAKRRFMNF